jgi:hypothetical protein
MLVLKKIKLKKFEFPKYVSVQKLKYINFGFLSCLCSKLKYISFGFVK